MSAELIAPSQDYARLICCTASRFIGRSNASDGNYVQGAADDSESWAHGLTPTLFWQHSQQLLDASEDELPGIIHSLHDTSKVPDNGEQQATLIHPTSTVFVGITHSPDTAPFDATIICSDIPTQAVSPSSETEATENPGILFLRCGPGKLGSRALRTQLSRVPPFIKGLRARTADPKILFSCSTGKDMSAGVALAVLCLYFDQNGKP